MKAVIAYYSLEGNIKHVARAVGNLIGADLIELRPVKPYPTGKVSKYISGRAAMAHAKPELEPYDADLSAYDTVIVATPVWAGNPAPPINTFIANADLSEKRIGIIVSSMSGNGGKCIDRIKEMIGKEPEVVLDLQEPKRQDPDELMDKEAAFARDLIGPYKTDEVWDLYDENGELLDMKMKRGMPIPEGCYHKIVSVWIRNSRGEYLLSKRTPEKLVSPGVWECTGGAVDIGETTLDAAIREVKEELGIELDPAKGVLARSSKHDLMREFYDVWAFEEDVDISEVKLQAEEVVDVRWMTKAEVEELWEKNEFNALLYYYKEVMY